MESILGKEHDMVMHALIPYGGGGTLDLYYYPNGIPGTAIATKELSYTCTNSSTNDKYEKYELVMFTRQSLNLDEAKAENKPFGKDHRNISSILNLIANYSAQAKLNPNETCEFPSDVEEVGGKCLILSAYEPQEKSKEEFGLMVIIEILRSEMEYARGNGGGKLIKLLQEKNVYPYSDLEREPVV